MGTGSASPILDPHHDRRRPDHGGTCRAGAVRGSAERPLRPAMRVGGRRAPPWPCPCGEHWGLGVVPKPRGGGWR